MLGGPASSRLKARLSSRCRPDGLLLTPPPSLPRLTPPPPLPHTSLPHLTPPPAGLIIADQFIKGYHRHHAYENGCSPLFETARALDEGESDLLRVYDPKILQMIGEGVLLYARFHPEPYP